MIYYKTNDNWFGDLRHLAKSWTMVRIMRSVLLIGVYAAVVCLTIEWLNLGRYVDLNTSVFSLLGVILSILLVFRTNSGYDRWWEARKQWGALVNTFHLMSIPLSMFIFFALLGVELLGEEIEDPFGLDCNDLPTGDIAHTIKGNVFEILESRHPVESRERELYEKVF